MNSKVLLPSRPGSACTRPCCPQARAKIEAFVEWAWDYFGKVKGDQVLDRFSQADIDWNDDSGEDASGPSAQTTPTKSDS